MESPRIERTKLVIGLNDFSVGGVQRLALDQARLLDRTRFEVHLVILTEAGLGADFYELLPSDIVVSRLAFKGFFDVKSWFRLALVLARIRPHVVKSSLFFSNTVFRTLSPFFGYACIAAEHNTDHIQSSIQVIIDRILSRITYAIVVDSKNVAEYVSRRERLPLSLFAVIYNGIDVERVASAEHALGPQRTELRKTWGVGESDFVFLTVARLVKQKNHALMIAAFARVASRRSDVRLIVVGGGACLYELQQQAERLEVSSRVIFTGEQMDLDVFYVMADVFLLTSIREGFCIAAMQGLAHGLPLLSTRVAGVSEYLADGENGLFVEADPSALSEKMITLIEAPPDRLRAMSARARRTANHYSLQRYIQASTELFKRAARTVRA